MKTRLFGLVLGLLLLAAVLLPIPGTAQAAEYNGKNIDGVVFRATVFSYATSRYYSVGVEFDGDDAIIYFPKGGRLTVSLDSEEIDDPDNISAFDYNRGNYWDIDLD